MKNRLLLLLIALMGVTLSASAESPYGLIVCGIEVTDENKADLVGPISANEGIAISGKMSYDSDAHTLHMDGVTIDAGTKSFSFKYENKDSYGNLKTWNASCSVIGTTADLIIELTGDNVCTNAVWCPLIHYSTANLTITGGGSLTLNYTHDYTNPMTIQKAAGTTNQLTFDHTTFTSNDGGLEGGQGGELVITESTVNISSPRYRIVVGFRSITLNNASIASPEGVYVKSGYFVNSNGNEVNSISIVPDLRKAAGLAWSTASYQYRIGSENTDALPTFSNPNGLAVTFESSNENLATVSPEGVITLTGKGGGSASITATFGGNTEYQPGKVGCSVIVWKGVPAIKFAEPTFTAHLGETCESPKAIVTNKLGEEVEVPLAYTSSDEGIATVDDSGQLTPVAVGTCTITAKVMKNDYYNDVDNSGFTPRNYTATYTLTVNERGEATLAFGQEAYTAIAGQTFNAPELANADNVPVTYTSSNEAVATVDAATGAVTAKSVGEAVITATFSGNDQYRPTSAAYTLTVKKITPSVAFAQGTATATYGQPFGAPAVATTPAGLALTFSSSDPSVATVDGATGAVTIVKAGTATITATFPGNDTYEAAEGAYTLTVEKADISIAFETGTYTCPLDMPFTSPVATTAPEGLEVAYSSSDEAVATVDAHTGAVSLVGEGTATITAAFPGTDNYNATQATYTLTVEPATSIAALREAAAAHNIFYNLSGQRVSRPRKGLYVSGGRKVLVK